MWLIIPGLILFCIPYFGISQYKYPAFRFMLLANVLLFVVLFGTGSEASGYIIAMIGVAIWYICSVSPHKKIYLLALDNYLGDCWLIHYRAGSIDCPEWTDPSVCDKSWPCIVGVADHLL